MEGKEPGDTPSYILEKNDVSIDLSMLYDVSGSDLDFLVKILKTFLDTMPQTLGDLEKEAEKSNWTEVYKKAHFAKSSLSVIKVGNMHELAFKIETSARNLSQLDAIPGSITRMKTQLDEARKALLEKYGTAELS
jgi:HPt (histidine-containing phosphotransfer) domain-containing protein